MLLLFIDSILSIIILIIVVYKNAGCLAETLWFITSLWLCIENIYEVKDNYSLELTIPLFIIFILIIAFNFLVYIFNKKLGE